MGRQTIGMARVFFTRTLPGRAREMIEAAGHEVDCWPGDLPPPREAMLDHLREAAAVITLVTDPVDREMLAAAPRLRIVANMAVGYDNIDPAMAAEEGVWVSNTPGVLHETTADFAFALLLAAARNVVASERDTRAGGWKTWSPTAFLGPDVHGATLGIVGLGEIGTAVARRARGFGMRILYTSRTRKQWLEPELGLTWCSLQELLGTSDFVTLHTPLTPETRNLIGAEQFAAMQRRSILVNTSRGGVIDQDALVAALRDRQIGGAALDVTVPEPLPLDHPLYAFPNVIITPHIASASFATRARMAEMAAGNVLAALEGREPPNALNRPHRAR
ncbi:MAG: glyoxylate reductase [Dehalococcoidia bacterium]